MLSKVLVNIEAGSESVAAMKQNRRLPAEGVQAALWADVHARTNVLPRILLVDDDPSFGKIMKRVAAKVGLLGPEITICRTLEEFAALTDWKFDIVIMDYDLGAVTGFELTTYIEHFTKEQVPVLLVSQTNQERSRTWPRSIRGFVHKELGPLAILDAAIEAHAKRYKSFT